MGYFSQMTSCFGTQRVEQFLQGFFYEYKIQHVPVCGFPEQKCIAPHLETKNDFRLSDA